MLLLSLYFSVLIPILSEWIEDEDLCYLDMAVCSQKCRDNFLKALQYCTILNTDISCYSKNFRSWMRQRGLGLKRLSSEWDIHWEEIESLFKSKQLSYIECQDAATLHAFLTSTGTTAENLKINSCDDYEVEESIARLCPNLQSIHLCSGLRTLPFIDLCDHLHTIYDSGCNLDLDRSESYHQRFLCDLKLTNNVDESTVCLREGKHFIVTGLYTWNNLSEKEYDTLRPLIKHLKKLSCSISGDGGVQIARSLDSNCSKLTSIDFAIAARYMNESQLRSLFKQCPSLRELMLKFKDGFANIDPLLDTISWHCRQLERFRVYQVNSMPMHLLSEVFKQTQLKYFCWKNPSSYVSFRLCPRGVRSSLEVTGDVSRDIVDEIVGFFGPFQRVEIKYYTDSSRREVWMDDDGT